MKYLVCSDARTGVLHTEPQTNGPTVDLGWGNYWSIVEAHSPIEAAEQVGPDNGPLVVVALDGDHVHNLTAKTVLEAT